MNDTIVAIATSVGISGINIIRLSGNESIPIVNKVFSKDLLKVRSHTINYGYIIFNNEKIDEVLVSVFKSPKTFTKEDVVEINCHGGYLVANKILEILLNSGARLAEPGEFIKRAFLNGRIDLVKAESVQDLINSKTENARKISMKGIEGQTSNLINTLKEEIMNILANIEINIDYPEYEDAVEITNNLLKDKISLIRAKLQEILEKSENIKLIKNGINIAIIGKPNVGKSSLLNRLLKEEKAIVTDIPGTTRDIVEGTILLKGIELKFYDTAGIRETNDKVEEIGVNKSYKTLEESDLILLVLDGNQEISKEDKDLLTRIDKNKAIIVINKTDLDLKIDVSELKMFEVVKINTVDDLGIDPLLNKIIEIFELEKINIDDFNYLSNSRQISIIKRCLDIIEEIEENNNNGISVDLIEIDLKRLWETLSEITGESYDETLLDKLFSDFCLGK